ncbi:hypothetical protein KLEP7_gp166 [Pseudaeromonas phage vB_PpeM_ KLEP7]|nr:hypothetical protein KLEP7_gp166 [Pseudaeromonas phage vB_PpeM_ KLEP7]
MSYADKCCGVCDQYQDLKETGHYRRSYGESEPIYKRFDVCNICSDCVKNKSLNNRSIKDFKIYKDYHTVDRSHGFLWYVDSETGEISRAHKSRFDDTAVVSKSFPWLYNATAGDVCIHSKDKRKLKKGLRKLGLKGKLSKLIK